VAWAEGADRPGRQSGGGGRKGGKMGVIGGIRHLTTVGAAKLQSPQAPITDARPLGALGFFEDVAPTRRTRRRTTTTTTITG